MSNEQLLSWATLLIAAATFAGVRVAFVQYRRQCNAQVFLEYTKRYEKVMGSFPEGARRARLGLDAPPPEQSPELALAEMRYLNLCSEEFYLWKHKYLAFEVWSIWEAELKRTLRSPIFHRDWASLKAEFASYPEFVQYVDAAQATGK